MAFVWLPFIASQTRRFFPLRRELDHLHQICYRFGIAPEMFSVTLQTLFGGGGGTTILLRIAG